MSLQPATLRIDENNRLLIGWSDGAVRSYRIRALRDACPCASCREKRNAPVDPKQLPMLSPINAQPMKILGMQPVGNYAYSITFSDGHDSGIFTFEFLHELGDVVV